MVKDVAGDRARRMARRYGGSSKPPTKVTARIVLNVTPRSASENWRIQDLQSQKDGPMAETILAAILALFEVVVSDVEITS